MSPSTMGLVTLAGVAVLVLMTAKIWSDTGRLQGTLEERLAQIDARIAQVGSKVDASAARAAAPPRQGPDPNRVYTVRTQGAPAKGPATAPITIAEFSDFQ